MYSTFKYLIFILIISFAAVSPVLAQSPKLIVEGNTFLVDEVIDISIDGLKKGQQFKVTATTFDRRNRPWIAEGNYSAESSKVHKIGDLVPKSGTYTGKDPMGLFWSANINGSPLDSLGSRGTFARRATLTYRTLFELEIDGELKDSISIYRSFQNSSVEAEEIQDEQVKARLFKPTNSTSERVIIVMAGSDGGRTSAEWRAALFASNGIPAVALAYFDYEGLPEDLIELPLEYLQRVVRLLKNEYGYSKVGLFGFSKGSEHTLTYSSKVKDNGVDAIAVVSPSSYVWQGINATVDVKSSWTLEGQPLDFVPWKYNQAVIDMFRAGGPRYLRVMYEHSLNSPENEEQVKKATLSLEEASAPLLAIAGTEDGSWPADRMMKELMQRLNKANYAYDYDAMIFEGAGHLIYSDYLPVTDSIRQSGQIFGGNIESNIEARRKAWPAILMFFEMHL